jgi:hypothetical protein
MDPIRLFCSVTLIFVLMLPLSAATSVLVLNPSADARIISYGGSLDHQNYAGDILSVYTSTTAGNIQRTLLRFDLSGLSLAADERVVSAVLEMVASTGFGGNQGKPMEVYRLLEPWSESVVTWLRRDTNLPWRAPGGDYENQVIASSVAIPGNNERVAWDVTRLVDDWIEQASPNYGLLLRSYDGNGLTFVQHESPQTNLWPSLTITVGPAPPRLKISKGAVPGELRLFWRGAGNAVLEESDGAHGPAWSDSHLQVSVQGQESEAVFSPSVAPRFFRLRPI